MVDEQVERDIEEKVVKEIGEQLLVSQDGAGEMADPTETREVCYLPRPYVQAV
jgi:hypothetical protein